MKKALISIFTVILFAVLAACGGNDPPPQTPLANQHDADADRAAQDEAERLAQEEAERIEREEAERLAREEAERLEREEAERLEAKRLAQEEAERQAVLAEHLNTTMDELQYFYESAQWMRVLEIADYLMLEHPNSEQSHDAEALASSAASSLEAAGEAILANFREDHDRIAGITWYQHSNSPRARNERDAFFVYLGQRDGTVEADIWKRIVFNYVGREWIFFDQAIINIDEHNTTINFSRDRLTRETFRGGVFERADISGTSHWEMLEAVATSDTTVVRLRGSGRFRDFTLRQVDKNAIGDALLLYNYLNWRHGQNREGND